MVENNEKILKENFNHVLYEIQMFIASAIYLFQFQKIYQVNKDTILEIDSIIKNNIYSEIFLLHYRILYEFFNQNRNNNKKKDDIELNIFLINLQDYNSKLNEINNMYSNRIIISDIHKKLAHLSTKRNEKDKPNNLIENYNYLISVINLFIKNSCVKNKITFNTIINQEDENIINNLSLLLN